MVLLTTYFADLHTRQCMHTRLACPYGGNSSDVRDHRVPRCLIVLLMPRAHVLDDVPVRL